MADNNFEFGFTFDWSQPERSTEQFIQKVRRELQRLNQLSVSGGSPLKGVEALDSSTKKLLESGRRASSSATGSSPAGKLNEQEKARASGLSAETKAQGQAVEAVNERRRAIDAQTRQAALFTKQDAANLQQLKRVRTQNALTSEGAVTAGDNKAAGELVAAKRRRATAEQQAAENAVNPGDIRANAELASSKRRRALRENLAAERTYTPAEIQATGDLVAAKRRRVTKEQQAAEGAITPQDRQASANLAAIKQRRVAQERAITTRQTASDQELLRANAESVVNSRLRSAREKSFVNEAALGKGPNAGTAATAAKLDAENAVNSKRIRAQQQALEEKAIASGPGGRTGFVNEQAGARSSQALLNAQIRAEATRRQAASSEYTSAVASTAISQRRLKAKVDEQVAKAVVGDSATLQREANAAVAKKTAANIKSAKVAEKILANQSGELDEIVRAKVANKRLTAAIQARVNAELKAAQNTNTAPGSAQGGGTLFQRLQSRFAQRGSGQGGQDLRAPEEFQRLGQFVGSKALTTGAFAFSGAALFGVVNTIQAAVEEANKFQVVMVSVEQQLISTDQAGQLPQFRKACLLYTSPSPRD